MTSFRSFLARERLVPVEQLDRALQRQILYGEDLAVNLLEMAVVDEDDLAQYLGMFLRLPIVTRGEIEALDPGIVERFPREAALRHRICPVAVADDTLVVAATRQLDRTVLRELERDTRKTVSQVVATPLAIAWGLHRHYGEEFPERYARILERQAAAARARPAEAEPAGEGGESAPRPRRNSGIIVLPDDLPPEDPEEATEAPGGPATSSPPDDAPEPGVVEAMEGTTAGVADAVLAGVSLSHDTAADRLLEVVLGPPSQVPPPPVAEAPAADAGPPPEALPDDPARLQPMRSVALQSAPEPPAPHSAVPVPLRGLVRPAPEDVPEGERTPLTRHIAELDTVDSPSGVLRLTFQAFVEAFRAGILFDTTGSTVLIREVVGHSGAGMALRGTEVAPGVVPSVVLNASQPLLGRIEPTDPLAELLLRLFGSLPPNALFLPIPVGTRVVAVFYGDNRDQPTAFDAVRDVFHLAWAAGTRLGDIIRERHRRSAAETERLDTTNRGLPPPPFRAP